MVAIATLIMDSESKVGTANLSEVILRLINGIRRCDIHRQNDASDQLVISPHQFTRIGRFI